MTAPQTPDTPPPAAPTWYRKAWDATAGWFARRGAWSLSFILRVWNASRLAGASLLAFTSWLLAVSENLLVIFITYCVAKSTWYLMLKDNPTIDTSVKSIEGHWRGALVLAVPLFYRTAREILSKVRKLPLGMEMENEKPNPDPPQRQNPSDDGGK